jgi:hypothetical protein
MDLKPQPEPGAAYSDSMESLDRRDLARKLGKFAAYAAPFTVLALTASAATGSGPGKHAKPVQPPV